jgi:hypothetical protein
MIVYILTSPQDSSIVLTVDPAMVQQIQQEAAKDGFQFEVLEWFSENRATMVLELEFKRPQQEPYVHAPVPQGGYHA